MDISTFRWILIVLGIAIIAGIFLLGNPERRRRSRKPSKKRNQRMAKARKEPVIAETERKEPSLSEAPRQEPTLEAGNEPTVRPELDTQPELPIEAGPMGDEESSSETVQKPEPSIMRSEPVGPPPEKIVLLYLQSRDNHRIAGADLLEAALRSGMEFGEQEIFHRRYEGDGRPLFSMANLENPGYFDKSKWNTFETKGVTMFMTLPGPVNALDAWDSMLATARRLGEVVHADLLANDRSPFTRTREGEVREELRQYERSLQPEG